MNVRLVGIRKKRAEQEAKVPGPARPPAPDRPHSRKRALTATPPLRTTGGGGEGEGWLKRTGLRGLAEGPKHAGVGSLGLSCWLWRRRRASNALRARSLRRSPAGAVGRAHVPWRAAPAVRTRSYPLRVLTKQHGHFSPLLGHASAPLVVTHSVRYTHEQLNETGARMKAAEQLLTVRLPWAPGEVWQVVAAAGGGSGEVAEGECRFCFAPHDDDDDGGALVSPCACQGTQVRLNWPAVCVSHTALLCADGGGATTAATPFASTHELLAV